MVKDERRGARTGRNIKLTVMLSEDAQALLDAAKAARSKGVKKTSYSELMDEAIRLQFKRK